MNVQIDSAIKHARAYWFIDGFIEMSMGGFFVFLAMLLLLSGSASPVTLRSWFLSMASEIAIAKLVGILAIILLLWWLKDHFTYPRTGFTRGKRITAAQLLMIIRNIILFLLLPILGLLAASLLAATTGNILALMPVWLPIAISILWACLLVFSGEWMGLHRFRILGGLILLTGIVIGALQVAVGSPTFPADIQLNVLQPAVVESINSTLTSLCFLIIITGAILIFSGIITFLRYRKENPTPYVEDV